MNFRTSFYSILLLALLFPIDQAKKVSKEFKAKVIAVKDGDTIDVLSDNRKITVRLAHIDCPEKKQPFGTVARQFTANRCFGQEVTVVNENKYDRNRRLIAVVLNERRENVNLELVKAGLAWHFKKYSTDSIYGLAEVKARRDRTGLWRDEEPVAPWSWRSIRALH